MCKHSVDYLEDIRDIGVDDRFDTLDYEEITFKQIIDEETKKHFTATWPFCKRELE